ncbi:MAG: hypothetical protein H7Y38_13960 [Armatimonadetes bacterium]|nr:hypothetical protein [Armatimonadota bacterium]
MTTQEVANRYYELIQRGQSETILNELYSPDIISLEPENDSQVPLKTVGIEDCKQKERQFGELIEEMHSGFCNPPIVSNYHFACSMGMDVTYKGRERRQKDQIGVFEVENGKIIKEQYFYDDFK